MQRSIRFFTLVVFIASGCATTADLTDGDERATPNTSALRAIATNPPGEPARLVRTIDGDSLEVEVDGEILDVRMLGINAPERDECHGDLARDALGALLGDSPLVLQADDEDRDQFDRLLRYVWVDGVDVNTEMLAAGHAIAVQSGHTRESEYLTAAASAAESERGMWSPDACGPSGGFRFDIERIQYDPPGRDFENTLDEWVDIRNRGNTDVDLTGWTLRDESTQHRYTFGPVAVASGETVRIRSGCGDDRSRDLAWCAGDAVWSNGGDTVLLQDSVGNVVAHFVYNGDF